MTYKELLFKMAKVGMLTLSNDKDGRGLFWVNMNNLEALDKEFDWRDFEVDFPPDKEFYIDKQGRKQEKHNGYEYSQPMFAQKNRIEDLPEDTRVQRVVKEHIMSLSKNEQQKAK